jgi:four helix bundle protein
MDYYFDHERLRVYQESIGFVAWCEEISDRVPGKLAVKDQLDRSSTSMPMNIAEGNGKRSSRERCHYFGIALGSAFESAAGLDVLVARKRLTDGHMEPGKKLLPGIASMLVGLIPSRRAGLPSE